MPKMAPALWGIPVVRSATERDSLFPNPETNQRVQNLGTSSMERWDGVQWTTDSQAALSVKRFGAKGDGTTDDSDAFADAATAALASGVREIYVPDGRYRIVTGFVLNGVVLQGQSKAGTILDFDPTEDGTCVELSNGASRCENAGVLDISFYSADTTYTKVALDLVDLSVCVFGNIDISGAGQAGVGEPAGNYWSGGTGSTGIRTRGREATNLRGLKIVADRPVYIDENPNTVPDDGEDNDHWHWSDMYLVAKGHPCIEVKPGLGINDVEFDGYQAWVGGTDGFLMNDTRTTPVISSRNILFANVRTEQQSTTGFAIRADFVTKCESFMVNKMLVAATLQGIRLSNVLHTNLLMVQATRGGALANRIALQVINPPGGASVNIMGCYWQPGSVFDLTGYTPTLITAYSTSIQSGPATATYAETVGATSILVGLLSSLNTPSVESLRLQATASGDGLQAWGNAAGEGAAVRGVNFDASEFSRLGYFATDHNFEIYDGTHVMGSPQTAPAFQIDAAGRMLTYFAHVVSVAAITYSASMTPNALAGNVQTITATNGTAFTINAPANAPTGASGAPIGQRLRIRIRNASGGALGTATWDSLYKLGASWTQPANGFSRAIEFDFNGTNWVEASRTAADVAN